MKKAGRGFTLVELIVVVLIIGILALFGYPQFIRTVETSKAEDAVATLQMVATTNRMYALDNSNNFTTGQLANGCNPPTACDTNAANHPACDLVACNYLASQSWSSKNYNFYAVDPVAGAGGAACGAAAGHVACAMRKDCASSGPGEPCAQSAPFTGWGYLIDRNGVVTTVGTDTPQPPQ